MEKPGVWARIKAFTRGEQDAETLYAYKRAGAPVHDLLDAAERRRFELAAGGTSPFEMSAQVGTELACTWNAFALQTLGDKMLEADEVADPDTAGFVPPVTFNQVQGYYQQVQQWLAYASRAGHDAAFGLPYGTLPARLPDWSPVEPCPRPHIDAMMAALKAMLLHAEAAMNALETRTPASDLARLGQVRGLYAQVKSRAEYAAGMYSPGASQALHEQVEEVAKKALEELYLVGQYLSYPALMTALPIAAQPITTPPTPATQLHPWRGQTPLPGHPDFNKWVMTDPNTRPSLMKDPQVSRVLDDMWKLDPDPRASLGLWEDIRAAEERGDVTYARHPGGTLIGYYFCAPYAAIYQAINPVMIGDTPVPRGQRFTIECAPEGTRIGYPFKREVVLGTFGPAQIDYCDPDAPPPHEE